MTIGDTVTCVFTVANIGIFPAEVTALTETFPFPGGTTVNISCTTASGDAISVGSILDPFDPCTGTLQVAIPDDPTLCNTELVDRVRIDLLYTDFPVILTAGADATHTSQIKCPADITITKDADALSKVGDSVTYTFVICNVGDVPVTRGSVTDTVLGDISASFPATLAPGQCVTVVRMRTVLATDPDPLVNTVTAIYNAGTGPFASSDTATDSASTELFQPSVDVTKNCTPDPVEVGAVVECTIVVTNTSSNDAPNLVNGTIVDTLTGNLLDPANLAVFLSNCAPILPTGGTCTIVTRRTVLASDPSELCNTVTVRYNPMGFPNIITDTARDCVVVKPPRGGEGCTPGFWKQEHHFDSWVGFSPNQTLESVFDVPDALGLDNVTLAEALALNGGGVNALLRHAVAALLNASNPDVNFDLTAAQVISATNAALASGNYEAQKDIFAAFNEQGCPLS